MNAFDKVNLDTSELMEGDVALLEQGPQAPVVPAEPKDPMLTEGVEIVRAEVMYGECHYTLRARNRDGSHAVKGNLTNDNAVIMQEAGRFYGDGPGYFYAKFNGDHFLGSNNSFTLLKPAKNQTW